MADDCVAYLGLGSNLGDRLGMLRASVAALERKAGIVIDSSQWIASLYESAPVDVQGEQPMYLNSAIRVQTVLAPEELLTICLAIEAELGRVRLRRGDARPLDIDVLLYEQQVINSGHLKVPHPRMHERRFVLEPLAEIAGEVYHPVLRTSIRDLAERIRSMPRLQPVRRVAGPEWFRLEEPALERNLKRIRINPPSS